MDVSHLTTFLHISALQEMTKILHLPCQYSGKWIQGGGGGAHCLIPPLNLMSQIRPMFYCNPLFCITMRYAHLPRVKFIQYFFVCTAARALHRALDPGHKGLHSFAVCMRYMTNLVIRRCRTPNCMIFAEMVSIYSKIQDKGEQIYKINNWLEEMATGGFRVWLYQRYPLQFGSINLHLSA